MKFPETLATLRDKGGRAARGAWSEWAAKDACVRWLDEGLVMFLSAQSDGCRWTPAPVDVEADDWHLVASPTQ